MTLEVRTPRPKAARIVDLSTTDEQVQTLLQGMERLRQRLEEEAKARALHRDGQISAGGTAVARLESRPMQDRPRWYYASATVSSGSGTAS